MTNNESTILTVELVKPDSKQDAKTKVVMECSNTEQIEKKIEDLIQKVFDQCQ